MSANMGVKHQMDQNFKKGKKRGGLRDLPGRRVLMLLSIPPGYWCHPASLLGTTATPGHAQAEGRSRVSTNMGFKHQMDYIFF